MAWMVQWDGMDSRDALRCSQTVQGDLGSDGTLWGILNASDGASDGTGWTF